MDIAEKEAEKYLKSLMFSIVDYEPDGNIPPDFLCDGRIAVEVRRLYQQERKTNGQNKSLEETAIPLVQQFQGLLKELGSTSGEHSWFVFYRFERPVKRWKKLKHLIKKYLEEFRDSENHERTAIQVTSTFVLEISKASKVFDNQFFVLGGYEDGESGGCLIAEVEKNLRFIVSEKTKKISKVRNKYPEWWLILVDHIGYALDDFDRSQFHDHVKVEHNWDKVILIDPRNGLDAFEI